MFMFKDAQRRHRIRHCCKLELQIVYDIMIQSMGRGFETYTIPRVSGPMPSKDIRHLVPMFSPVTDQIKIRTRVYFNQ